MPSKRLPDSSRVRHRPAGQDRPLSPTRGRPGITHYASPFFDRLQFLKKKARAPDLQRTRVRPLPLAYGIDLGDFIEPDPDADIIQSEDEILWGVA